MKIDSSILMIGIGNAYRGDDRAGLYVAQLLKERLKQNEENKLLSKIEIQESNGEITELMERWQGFSQVIAVDAMASPNSPGEIMRFAVHEAPLPAETFQYSTHGLSLAEAIELARAMKQLPSYFILYAIGANNFTAGKALSPEVAEACHKVSKEILKELS